MCDLNLSTEYLKMQKRYIVMLMMMFLYICNTFVTININVAIISMVPAEKKNFESNQNRSVICSEGLHSSYERESNYMQSAQDIPISDHIVEGTYDWSNYEKGLVLSAYHWLSWLSIMPGGILAQKYGSKIVAGYTQFICSVMSSLIPLVADYGINAVILVRMMQGFFSFLAVPGGATTIIGNWSTEHDRGKHMAALLVGASLALGSGSFLFGFIGENVHWKYIFHFTSISGIVWTVFWYFLIYDFPDKHPTISAKEKAKIRAKMNGGVTKENTQLPIPWIDILTNIPVIISTINYSAIRFIFCILITFMPLYINNIFGLNSNQAGVIIGVPQFFCGPIGFIIGSINDTLIQKGWLSVTVSRKILGSVTCLLSSISLLIMAFTSCNVLMMVICNAISMIFLSISVCGLQAVIVDLTPNFCGILQGILGTSTEVLTLAFATGMSFLMKILPIDEFWKIVFIFTASSGIITSFMFILWGSAEIQSWNYGPQEIQKPNSSQNDDVIPINERSRLKL